MNQALKSRLFMLLGALFGALVSWLLQLPFSTGVAFGAGFSVPISILMDKSQPLKQRLILSAAILLLILVALISFFFWFKN